MRKDQRPIFDRFEAGEDVPIGEMAGVVVVNGCLGVVQGLLAMVAALLAMGIGAAVAGMPGFIIAMAGSLWWSYRVFAKNRTDTAEINTKNALTASENGPEIVSRSGSEAGGNSGHLPCIKCGMLAPNHARSCPSCGYIQGLPPETKVEAKNSNALPWVLGGFALIVGAAVMIGPADVPASSSEKSDASSQSLSNAEARDQVVNTDAKATSVSEGKSPASQFAPRAPSAAASEEHRREKLSFIQDTPARDWLVRIRITACPRVQDWYPGAEAIARLDFENIPDVPISCWKIQPGQIIRLPPASMRKIDVHVGHMTMQAIGPDGRAFWTDEFDRLSVEPIGRD